MVRVHRASIYSTYVYVYTESRVIFGYIDLCIECHGIRFFNQSYFTKGSVVNFERHIKLITDDHTLIKSFFSKAYIKVMCVYSSIHCYFITRNSLWQDLSKITQGFPFYIKLLLSPGLRWQQDCRRGLWHDLKFSSITLLWLVGLNMCWYCLNRKLPVVTVIARFMGPTWGPSGADRTQVGPMWAPWTLLSG